MNTIKIYLKPSGSVAELYKDFALFVNAYQNKLVDVYGSKYQFENGSSKSQFEPLTENEEIKVEKKMVDGKNKEMKVEDRRVCNRTNKTKEKQETEKRLSNHIEFIDYIPIHEVITYRHLFDYGFYVE